MRVTMPRTLGAFSICMEMYGSGRRMLGGITQREPKPIRLTEGPRAPPVLFGAGLGTLQARTCVRPAAPATPRATATTGSASVSVSNSSELGTEG